MYKQMLDPMTGQINQHAIRWVSEGIDMGIPFNPANTDYQEYLKWVAEGNTPEPAEGTE
jgi:hypothetical protein